MKVSSGPGPREVHVDGDTASISLARDELAKETTEEAAKAPGAHDGAPAAATARKDEVDARAKVRGVLDEDQGGRRRGKKRAREDGGGEDALEDLVIEAPDVLVRGGPPAPTRARFEPGGAPEPGDLALLDPRDIRRVHGTPVAYAKHALILGEAFRRTTGATRAEAIAYLARLFLGAGDPAFGRAALKELGPATGILDVYPLEVVTFLVERAPWFLPKVGWGRLFRRTAADEGERETSTETPIILEYPEHLQVRGFALEGGGRPGYVFEPDAEPGRYRLQIRSRGRYRVLISALTRSAHTIVDRIVVRVRPVAGVRSAPGKELELPARDERKVAEWPLPEWPTPTTDELLAAVAEGPARTAAGLMPMSELVAKTLSDRARGAKSPQASAGGLAGGAGADPVFEDEDATFALDVAALESPLDLDHRSGGDVQGGSSEPVRAADDTLRLERKKVRALPGFGDAGSEDRTRRIDLPGVRARPKRPASRAETDPTGEHGVDLDDTQAELLDEEL